MACYSPLKGWWSRVPGPNGKAIVVFNPKLGWVDRPVELPCGKCIGCRLEYSRQWAVRCMHEASLYENNYFVTLTYDDEHVPANYSLDKSHFQKFMKRLRKRLGRGARYFHCGEYGENYGRPHYHAILFNVEFPDLCLWRISPAGHRVYRSKILESLWPFGNCELGNVSFEAAAYVARYVVKKADSVWAEYQYSMPNPLSGEVVERAPEYVTMSRRPGIGAGWYEKFSEEVFPSDFIVMRGVKMRPPKFYDKLLQSSNETALDDVKARRKGQVKRHGADQTHDRLVVREKVQRARVSKLKRS